MRILIVEDEARIGAFLARAFEAEGFAVELAADGERGLARAVAGATDLVILDLMLPGRDGLGAVDYVAKPFALDEVLARARVQLRRAPSAGAGEGTMLRVGRLVLDVAGRQARVGDTMTDLSDREFRLLHVLMAHVGEVVSRERLLAEVWGYDFDPRSNVVDVCVRRLRRRLGPQAPIETVRNVGYRAAA